MARINDSYLKLASGYLFPEIDRRVDAFCEHHPSARLIRLGIGDVVLRRLPVLVKGRVVERAGNAVAGAAVHLAGAMHVVATARTRPGTGTFEIRGFPAQVFPGR